MKNKVINILLVLATIFFCLSVAFGASNLMVSKKASGKEERALCSRNFNTENKGLKTPTGWVTSLVSCKDNLTNQNYSLYELNEMSEPINQEDYPELYNKKDGSLNFDKLNLTDKIYHETSYSGDGTKYDSFIKLCSMRIDPSGYDRNENKIIKTYVFYQLKNEENPVFYSAQKVCTGTPEECEYLYKEIYNTHLKTIISSDIPAKNSIEASNLMIKITGVNTFKNAIITSSKDSADTASCVSLSGVCNAPVFYYTPSKPSLNDETSKYLTEHLIKGGVVYLVGGISSIPKEYEDSLKASGFNTVRLYGNDRYITNLDVVRAVRDHVKSISSVIVVSGNNPSDIFSAAGIASARSMPVYLVNTSLTEDIKKDLSLSGKDKVIYILGGKDCVSEEVEKDLSDYGKVKRIAGKNRYETSIKIAEEFSPYSSAVCLASASKPESAVSGTLIAKQFCAPIILTESNNDSEAEMFSKEKSLNNIFILGE